MKEDTRILLSLPNLPGRIGIQECADILGFTVDAVYILIRANCLRPLGRSRQGAVKLFSSLEVRALAANRDWLSRATDVVSGEYGKKNAAAKMRRRLGVPRQAHVA